MSKEKIIEFANNNYYETNDESLEKVREMFISVAGRDVSLDDIKMIQEDLLCDGRDNLETRLFNTLNTIVYQIHCLSHDIKETLEEGEYDE